MDSEKFTQAKALSEKINTLIDFMNRFGHQKPYRVEIDFCTEIVLPFHDEYRRKGLEALNTELWRLQDEFAKL